ncbi:MAG: putative peptidase [Acidobacteria bacterium]|nr:putative peptidase [Acidobacteriota bacterium]
MDEEKIDTAPPTSNDEPQISEVVKPSTPWTVLTFLGGENNLSDEMVLSIKAMKNSVIVPPRSAGKVKFHFNALVQFEAEYSALLAPVRFELKPGDYDGSAHGDYVKTMPEDRAPCLKFCDSYVCELVDFLYWGIKKYPAQKYFVIFSGHGNGVQSSFLQKDTVPPQSLTIKQLREVLEHPDVKDALKSVGKDQIDIIGFDSCLMSMVEVCYELRHDAQLLVGSEGNEANLGWPYKAIFEYLQVERNPSLEDLAVTTVNSMVMYYADYSIIANSSADLAVCDLRGDKIEKLTKNIDNLGRVMMKHLPKDTSGDTIEKDGFLQALIFAHWYAQTYSNDQYADLADFCDVLSRHLTSQFSDVVTACKRVQEGIKSEAVTDFVIHSCYTGPMYQYSNGVSIYFPWSEIYPPYHDSRPQLDFLKDTCWLDFLRAYVKKTQRPKKPGGHDIGDKMNKFRDRDSFPRSRGTDDPSLRGKNPAHEWDAPDCLWGYFETLLK